MHWHIGNNARPSKRFRTKNKSCNNKQAFETKEEATRTLRYFRRKYKIYNRKVVYPCPYDRSDNGQSNERDY